MASAQDHRAHDPRGLSRAHTPPAYPRDTGGAAPCYAGLACSGVSRPSPPFPSHPKSSFSLTLCFCSSSPVLVLLPGLLAWPAIPLPSPGMVDHEELPCSNTRLWAEEGCFPTLGHKQLRVWKREESPPPKHQETASPCTLLSHPEVLQEPAEFPTEPALPTEAEWPKKGLQESHDCTISASPSSTPCSPLLPTLHRGLTTARENQQGSSQQAPTCVPGLSRSLLQRAQPCSAPSVSTVSTEAKLPFSKEGKKPPRSFLFCFMGGPNPAALQLGMGQTRGHLPPP